MGLVNGEWVSQPVIEEQELNSGQGVEQFGVGAIDVRECDVVEETGSALVTNSESLTASHVAQGAGEESLPDTGRAQDDDVQVTVDPITLSQFEDKLAVNATGWREIEVFNGGR